MLAYRLLQPQMQPEFRSTSSRCLPVVELTALGRLKVPVARYPLSAAKQAYDDFEHGRLCRAHSCPARGRRRSRN